MYQTLLADVRFHELLLKIDHDLADTARGEGCSCGGVLHSARYRRKPRRLPAGLDEEEYCWRFSFCCAVDGCRQRNTPPSLRFLGRRLYLATMVVLISALLSGATPKRMRRISQLLGVSSRTIARWQEWWPTAFANSQFWQAKRGGFMPPVAPERLPASLLKRFGGGAAERLLALLRFLEPISGGAIGHAW